MKEDELHRDAAKVYGKREGGVGYVVPAIYTPYKKYAKVVGEQLNSEINKFEHFDLDLVKCDY